MGLWYDEVFEDRTRFGLRVTRTLFDGKSEYQRVEVIETAQFGRTLVIDGVFMTSERDEHFYHEMLVHPSMTIAPSIKRVLVVGGGDGGTIREVLRYPDVEQVVMVEIDALVVEASKAHLPTLGSAFEDPRLDLRIGDAIEYVKSTHDPGYDVLIVDGTDPVGPGAGLFGPSFLKNAKRVLREGGVFSMQTESPVLFPTVFVETQKNLRALFKKVQPAFAPVPLYASGIWSFTVASDQADPKRPDETRVRHAESWCKYYNGDIHLGSQALPQNLRGALAD